MNDKNKERSEKLKADLEKARRNAAKLQDALDTAEALKEASPATIEKVKARLAEAEERVSDLLRLLADMEAKMRNGRKKIASKSEKGRVFAAPVTAEDTEPEIPSVETRSETFNRNKTIEEIVEHGTLLEKVRLYICSLDAEGYFGTDGDTLPNEYIAKINKSIKTDEDREKIKDYFREYRALREYGEHLRYFFKRFQTNAALLATYLNQLDSYKQMAKNYTEVVNNLLQVPARTTSRKAQPEARFISEADKEKTVELMVRQILANNPVKGARLLYNELERSFYVEEFNGQLYAQILKTAKSTTEAMADFKAYVVVVEKEVKESELKYIPISIQMCLENVQEERFIRFIVPNLEYFRSELNHRAASGEIIHLSEDKRAVIPDYFEVKPSSEVVADCAFGLNNIKKSYLE